MHNKPSIFTNGSTRAYSGELANEFPLSSTRNARTFVCSITVHELRLLLWNSSGIFSSTLFGRMSEIYLLGLMPFYGIFLLDSYWNAVREKQMKSIFWNRIAGTIIQTSIHCWGKLADSYNY